MFNSFLEAVRANPGTAGALATIGLLIVGLLEVLGFRKAMEAIWMRLIRKDAPPKPEGRIVDVEYRERPTKNSDMIVVQNDSAHSDEITITDISTTGEQKSPFASNGPSRKLPAVLEPGQSVSFLAATHKQCLPPHDVKVKWRDQSGKQEVTTKTVYR